MTGAEGERRLDLDGHIVRPDSGAVMRAMDEKAAGPDRGEASQRVGDPVGLLGASELDALCGLLARRDRDQLAQTRLVGLEAEIGLHDPVAAPLWPGRALERARRRFGWFEALDDQIDDRAGATLVADEAQAVGGVVGRQAFEHGGEVLRWNRRAGKAGEGPVRRGPIFERRAA